VNLEVKNLTLDVRDLKADAAKETGFFTGYASTFNTVDSYDDVIEPGAFKETIADAGGALPMLWAHDADEVIGVFRSMREDAKGLKVRGELALAVRRGAEAYALLKSGAIKAPSIGFTIPTGGSRHDGSVRRISRVKLWEISLVLWPANAEAAITAVKNRTPDEWDELQRFRRVVAELERRQRDERDAASIVQELRDEYRRYAS